MVIGVVMISPIKKGIMPIKLNNPISSVNPTSIHHVPFVIQKESFKAPTLPMF